MSERAQKKDSEESFEDFDQLAVTMPNVTSGINKGQSEPLK